MNSIQSTTHHTAFTAAFLNRKSRLLIDELTQLEENNPCEKDATWFRASVFFACFLCQRSISRTAGRGAARDGTRRKEEQICGGEPNRVGGAEICVVDFRQSWDDFFCLSRLC